MDADEFRPYPELTQAIRNFSVLRNVTEMEMFFRLCQQVGNFSSKIAASLELLSPLPKKNLCSSANDKMEEMITKLKETVANGFPSDRCNIPPELMQF